MVMRSPPQLDFQNYLSFAKYSDMASAPAQSCLSFPRVCLARVRNPESSA
jgi:hypothetical protein